MPLTLSYLDPSLPCSVNNDPDVSVLCTVIPGLRQIDTQPQSCSHKILPPTSPTTLFLVSFTTHRAGSKARTGGDRQGRQGVAEAM